MSCKVEFSRAGNGVATICNMSTFAHCSDCGIEICLACMKFCCQKNYCPGCEQGHVNEKHAGVRPLRSRGLIDRWAI
jgi:hypothetical protein